MQNQISWSNNFKTNGEIVLSNKISISVFVINMNSNKLRIMIIMCIINNYLI